MVIIEMIGGVLLALSALGFLLLGAFDRPLVDRRRIRMSPSSEPGSGIAATVRLLRASLATLKLASVDCRSSEAGDTSPRRNSRNLEKIA